MCSSLISLLIARLSVSSLGLFLCLSQVDHKAGTVTVDGWIKFKAPARVAVLVKRLRRELDAALQLKISDPSGFDITKAPVAAAIERLVATDGDGGRAVRLE